MSKHTTDRFGFFCRACDELIEKYESEGMTTSDAQGCAGADHITANLMFVTDATAPKGPGGIAAVAILAASLLGGGCAIVPNSIRPEFEHMSHLTQHEPITNNQTHYGADIVNLVA